jgi:hypothetical protein
MVETGRSSDRPVGHPRNPEPPASFPQRRRPLGHRCQECGHPSPRDPAERRQQRRRATHEVEQVIETAAKIGHRPTMKFGPYLRYFPQRTHRSFTWWLLQERHRCSAAQLSALQHPLFFSKPLPPFPMCTGFPWLGVLRRLRHTRPFSSRCAYPTQAGRLPTSGRNRDQMVPVFTVARSTDLGARLCPSDLVNRYAADLPGDLPRSGSPSPHRRVLAATVNSEPRRARPKSASLEVGGQS